MANALRQLRCLFTTNILFVDLRNKHCVVLGCRQGYWYQLQGSALQSLCL